MTWQSLFKTTHVISLHGKVERQAAVKRELQRVGMNLSHVSFFTGSVGKKKDIIDLVIRLGIIETAAVPFFSPGHLGCLFSHYSIWQKLFLDWVNTDEEEGWHLIMEDDVCFCPEVSVSCIQKIWSELPSDAKLVKFHTNNGFKDEPSMYAEVSQGSFMKQKKIVFSLMCYAIHTSLLKSLLMKRWTYHIDLFHTEGTYILKRIGSEVHRTTLYDKVGFFSQGICIPNNMEDSDTSGKEELERTSALQHVKLLFDDVNQMKEGSVKIHLYDEVTPTTTCHVLFEFQLVTYRD